MQWGRLDPLSSVVVCMNRKKLMAAIRALTIPCHDNGIRFTEAGRVVCIETRLSGSCYTPLIAPPLARVFRHTDFSAACPYLLVSCHVDSIYEKHWCARADPEIHGTLDNSACNAVALQAMMDNRLHVQTVVSFTGNEEYDSLGAHQTIEGLQERGLWDSLGMAIVLDLTEECYGSPFTVENLFVQTDHGATAQLKFRTKKELKRHVRGILGACPVIPDGDPDESWEYDEHRINCFSYCLPCRLLADDMHDDQGVAIEVKSLLKYADGLVMLSHAIGHAMSQPST